VIWTAIVAVAAAVTAAVAIYEFWWKRPRIEVSFAQFGRRTLQLTAQMKRGRPVTLHRVGVRLRDGTRQTLRHFRPYGDMKELPYELKPGDRADVALDTNELHNWLVATNRGERDVELTFYFEDGAGAHYDLRKWAVASAERRTIDALPVRST
jgi:hypothetical protein